MFPIVTIGGHNLSTYYFFCAFASVSIPVVIILRRKIFGFNLWQTLLLCFSAITSGFFGCNTLYWLENPDQLIEHGWKFSGFSFFGCMLFAPLIMVLFSLIFKLPVSKAMDLLAVGLPPFLAVVRIGCFCGGCCGGISYMLSNGKSFTVPTQLIECAFCFLIFAFILRLENKKKLSGLHFPLFLVLYGVLRFTVEFFRVTDKSHFGLSLGQIYSVVIVIIGSLILLLSHLRSDKAKKTTETA